MVDVNNTNIVNRQLGSQSANTELANSGTFSYEEAKNKFPASQAVLADAKRKSMFRGPVKEVEVEQEHVDEPQAKPLPSLSIPSVNIPDKYQESTAPTLPWITPKEQVSGLDIASNILAAPAVVTSHYGTERPGHTHKGIDLRAAVGTPLYAPFDGKVVRSVGFLDGNRGGRRVQIQSSDGALQVFVMHLSSVAVVEGSQVKQGDFIGRSGRSGKTENQFAPHVHYELKVKSGGTYQHVDPESHNIQATTYAPTYGEAEIVNLQDITIFSAEAVSRNAGVRNKNPGNDTGATNPFALGKGAGGSGNKYHTKYTSFVNGYAGNAWQVMLYITGKSSHMSKNPTLRQVVETWVMGSSDDSHRMEEKRLSAYERYSGISRNQKLSFSKDLIYRLVLTIGFMDSGYLDKSACNSGVDKAIALWLDTYPDTVQKKTAVTGKTTDIPPLIAKQDTTSTEYKAPIQEWATSFGNVQTFFPK